MDVRLLDIKDFDYLIAKGFSGGMWFVEKKNTQNQREKHLHQPRIMVAVYIGTESIPAECQFSDPVDLVIREKVLQ